MLRIFETIVNLVNEKFLDLPSVEGKLVDPCQWVDKRLSVLLSRVDILKAVEILAYIFQEFLTCDDALATAGSFERHDEAKPVFFAWANDYATFLRRLHTFSCNPNVSTCQDLSPQLPEASCPSTRLAELDALFS